MNVAVAIPPRMPTPERALRSRLLGVGLFALSFGIAVGVVGKKHAIMSLLAGTGIGAYPIAIGVFALVAAAPFSVTDALAVSNGVLFGPVVGSLVNVVGLVLGAVIGYFIACRTSRLFDLDSQIRRLPSWVHRFRVGSPLFLVLVRIIPGVGGTLATQVAAAMRVPLLRHVTTFCIVTIPFCTLLAFGGGAISSYLEQHIMAPAEGFATRHHMRAPYRAQH